MNPGGFHFDVGNSRGRGGNHGVGLDVVIGEGLSSPCTTSDPGWSFESCRNGGYVHSPRLDALTDLRRCTSRFGASLEVYLFRAPLIRKNTPGVCLSTIGVLGGTLVAPRLTLRSPKSPALAFRSQVETRFDIFLLTVGRSLRSSSHLTTPTYRWTAFDE